MKYHEWEFGDCIQRDELSDLQSPEVTVHWGWTKAGSDGAKSTICLLRGTTSENKNLSKLDPTDYASLVLRKPTKLPVWRGTCVTAKPKHV